MAKIKSNFIELLLYGISPVGLTVYDDEDNPIKIDNINLQPQIDVILIQDFDSSISAKLSLKQNYDFDVNNKTFKKILPNHKKIKGRLSR